MEKPGKESKQATNKWHLHPSKPHALFIGARSVECPLCRRAVPVLHAAGVRRFLATACPSATSTLPSPDLADSFLEVSKLQEEKLQRRGMQQLTLVNAQPSPAVPDAAEASAQGAPPPPSLPTSAILVSKIAIRHNPLLQACALAVSLFGADWRAKVHHTHRVCLSPPLIGCRTCGVYASATKRFYGLKKACPPVTARGAPAKALKAHHVRELRAKRLLSGKHPETGEVLDGPARSLPRARFLVNVFLRTARRSG